MAGKKPRRPQLNLTLEPGVHARIPEIVQKARDVLHLPELSIADAIASAMDLFDRWIDHRRAARTAEVESLGELEVEPQEMGKPGRPRTSPPIEDAPRRPRGRPRKATE